MSILSQSTRRIALPLLAAALLMLQALGLWHRVVHGQPHGHAAPAVSGHAHAEDGHHGHHGHAHDAHEDHAFAGHDEGDPQCRLYDQLAHADIAFGAASAAASLCVASGPDADMPSGRWAPQAAGFLARGPPVAG